MTYRPLKTAIFILFFCLLAVRPVYAQSNAQMMHEIMLNAMTQYGQKLYDRGDFDEATAVFNHVLSYDNHEPHALEYLKDMGRLPVPETLGPADILNDSYLKAAIAAKKASIEKLKSDIKQLRANIAAQAALRN